MRHPGGYLQQSYRMPPIMSAQEMKAYEKFVRNLSTCGRISFVTGLFCLSLFIAFYGALHRDAGWAIGFVCWPFVLRWILCGREGRGEDVDSLNKFLLLQICFHTMPPVILFSDFRILILFCCRSMTSKKNSRFLQRRS